MGLIRVAGKYNGHDFEIPRSGQAMADNDEPAVELRPAHVQDWLDALPYADFVKTAQLVEAALRATSAATVKPALRFELVACYRRPYEYLLQALIDSTTQPATLGAEALQQRIEALKRLALELAFGTRLAAREAGEKKPGFSTSEAATQANVGAARLLSQALMLNYHGYGPTPRNVWRELNELYQQCEQAGVLQAEVSETGAATQRPASIAGIYVQTSVTALADPYHLPPGAVWDIYAQVQDWCRLVRVGPYREARNPAGLFVIDLTGTGPPIAHAKFDARTLGPQHRLLDCTPITRAVQVSLEQLNAGKSPAGLKLQRQHARVLLEFLQRAWGLPPKRYFPRQEKKGAADIACGYNAAYFHCNGGHEFTAAHDGDAAADEEEALVSADAAQRYLLERWSFVDEGPGGFAVYSAEKPRSPVRVGEIVAVQEIGEEPDRPWLLGVIRWLMVQRNLAHKVGIQLIARAPETIVVRAQSDDEESEPQRAFMLSDLTATNGFTLVTPRGFYREQRPLEATVSGAQMRLHTGSLRESAASYDHFSCRR
ncbi:MAG: hypothetical protein IT495_11385 [Gammaproteobacteria bacterium]|nr:hypothetical protein [Gammaproteobacteria bacterium]